MAKYFIIQVDRQLEQFLKSTWLNSELSMVSHFLVQLSKFDSGGMPGACTSYLSLLIHQNQSLFFHHVAGSCIFRQLHF